MVDINATLIAQIINFLILLFILKKFAYGPLMQVMKEREDKISSSLEAADNDKKAAEELKAQYQKQLALARTQAQEIVDKAIKIAEESKQQILAEARAENERMLQNAKAEIEREVSLHLGMDNKDFKTLKTKIVRHCRLFGQACFLIKK